jgi:hypothetical protein
MRAMRKHPAKRQAPSSLQVPTLTIGRVDRSRWEPEPSLNGPRHCPEYAIWTLGPSRRKTALR